MPRIPLSPPDDAIRSFVAGRENPAGMNARFFLNDGGIEGEWTVTPALEGWGGLAHGVAVAALHDEAAINAIVFLLGQTGFTRRLDVRYLRPVRVGDRLQVRARIGSSDARGGVVTSEVLGPDGKPVSTSETDYVFVDAATVARVLGRPLSPELAAWFGMDRDARIAAALAWSARRAP